MRTVREVPNVINIKNAPQGQQGISNSVGLIHYSPDPDAIYGQSNSCFRRWEALKSKQTRGAWPGFSDTKQIKEISIQKLYPGGRLGKREAGDGRRETERDLSLYKLLLYQMP